MKPMIFLNTAWMERYQGLVGNDEEIRGGGSYVDEHGFGYEIFNFKEIGGKVYGYAHPGGRHNLQRLGASKDDEYIDGILIVFTATHKNGGTFMVGWYKDATFFRSYQSTRLKERKFGYKYVGYYAVADAENATLLSPDERFSFPAIPRGVKGGMGQSNVWYADSIEMVDFRKEVLEHIEEYEEKKSKRLSKRMSRQTDVEARKKVEEIAVREVSREYSDRGFSVTSVESQNLGWDLEAVFNKTELKIEVKGLSGREVSVEITRNEFEGMNAYKDSYRLCVVTDCLDNPTLHVFSYSAETDEWLSEDGDLLVIDEIISARCYI